MHSRVKRVALTGCKTHKVDRFHHTLMVCSMYTVTSEKMTLVLVSHCCLTISHCYVKLHGGSRKPPFPLWMFGTRYEFKPPDLCVCSHNVVALCTSLHSTETKSMPQRTWELGVGD